MSIEWAENIEVLGTRTINDVEAYKVRITATRTDTVNGSVITKEGAKWVDGVADLNPLAVAIADEILAEIDGKDALQSIINGAKDNLHNYLTGRSDIN